MAKECVFTGRTVSFGNKKTYRGKAKYLGGVGKKITGTAKRRFKPNLQSIRVAVDGETRRARVCVQCIRSGNVTKPVKRKPFAEVRV